MAAVLKDKDDEIIFVDYNTPDDFPTFPEAVYDNLTDSAREKVRVLRVREEIHKRYTGKTHLSMAEPVARNVGLRRSNPSNRWILATNTDLIFAPLRQASLTAIVKQLPNGFYGAPRIEVPETLWESLDRRDPKACIRAVTAWGSRFHLNEIVYGNDDIHFDAPGDFQLMLRSDLFANDGFDEGMLSGWHVDYNISKRLRMLYGKVGDLSDSVVGYHCDHTRQVTPMHKHGGVENSTDLFVDAVDTPDIPAQRTTWGCAGEPIEEISLKSPPSLSYIANLEKIIVRPQKAPLKVRYTAETYGKTSYSPEHLLPFLADLFSSAPRHWSVGWIGINWRMLDLFGQAWTKQGFSADQILIPEANLERLPRSIGPGVGRAASLERIAEANAFVFDFTTSDGASLAEAQTPIDEAFAIDFGRAFRSLLTLERQRMADGAPPRRFIGLNAIHNDFERVIVADVGAARTPFSLRMRHGFVLKDPPIQPTSWLPAMYIGVAGASDGAIFKVDKKGEALTGIAKGAAVRSNGEEGHMVYGPYLPLRPGRYHLAARIAHARAADLEEGRLIIEVACDSRFYAQRGVTPTELSAGLSELDFEIVEEDVTSFQLPRLQFRVWTEAGKALVLSDVQVTERP